MTPRIRPRRLSILVALAASAMLAAAYSPARSGDASTPAACTSPTNQYVSMVVKNPDGTVQTTQNIPWIQGANVGLAMENAQQINPGFSFQSSVYCPYGRYATAINGFSEGGNHYWALFVNGQYAQSGIDTQPINPGDVITWQVEDSSASPTARADSHQLKLLRRHRERRLDILKAGTGR